MKPRWRVATLLTPMLLGGCAQIGYYAQAVHGEMSVLKSAQPIDDVLATPETSDKLKERLNAVKEIRRFAINELRLPDNASYTTYADLKRPYVLWNVIAAPELSLTPKQWCFPVAGCVSYRGYYHEDAAIAFGDELRAEGYDVKIGGVPAYSTLGWFNDPVLSTFIGYSKPELARMIFHELAHQVVYAKGDSQFNESFATAVEEEGVTRWMATFGDDKMKLEYAAQEQREVDFLALLLKYRKKLESNYARTATDDDKRQQKAAIFQALKDEYQSVKAGWGGYTGYDRWFAAPLSNADLALIATYHDFVPAFKVLLQRKKTFPQFYEAVRALSKLDSGERRRQLAFLMSTTQTDDSGCAKKETGAVPCE
jgi:predicted aminopeptidase